MTQESSNETFVEVEVLAYDGSNNSYLSLGAIDSGATNHGTELSALVTSFVDDGRARGANDKSTPDATASLNIFHTMSFNDRSNDSALLHTKGGWRDHTDGNRITTTRGDKVEVIHGNYKMVVLGREQWNADGGGNAYGAGLHHESSGGITYHYDEVPGQVVDARWHYDEGVKTWRLIEECTKGHNVERYHGVKKEWMTGGDVVTRVGSLAAYDAATDGSPSDTSDDFITDDHFDKPDNAEQDVGSWPVSDTIHNVREEVFASSVKDFAVAETFETYIGSKHRKANLIKENSVVTELVEENYYKDYDLVMKGTIAAEFWFGALYCEVFDGLNVTVKSYAFADFRVGFFVTEVNAISIGELNIAPIVRYGKAAVANSMMDFVAAPATTEFAVGFVWELEAEVSEDFVMFEHKQALWASFS